MIDIFCADPTQVLGVAVDVTSDGEGPPGARGNDAGQDAGWGPLSGGFSGGEVIDGPPLEHAATYATFRLWSRTGVAIDQTLGIQQNGTLVASVVMAPAALPTRQSFAIGPLAGEPGDVFSLQMPNLADVQLDDLTASLGSTP